MATSGSRSSGPSGSSSPTTDSLVKEVPLPSGGNEETFGIAVGPNGNIWYTEAVFNTSRQFVSFGVGEIDSTTKTVIGEIPVSSAAEPVGIMAGPDGNVWFTVPNNGSTAGTIDESPGERFLERLRFRRPSWRLPSPVAITKGPDGNLWFADGGGAVGVVDDTQLVVTAQPPPDVSVGSPFSLTVTDEYTSGVVDTAFHGSVTMFLVQIRAVRALLWAERSVFAAVAAWPLLESDTEQGWRWYTRSQRQAARPTARRQR